MAATLARRHATSEAAKLRAQPVPSTPADRKAHGKRLRDAVPHFAHAAWRAHAGRADPLSILRAADATRQKHLVPLRYGRMLHSPFTFYRGSAGVMAADLARTPAMGIHVQACGDAHLMNFGGFATPERRLIFDINDLDETLPAPWEWDVKRLVASFVLAARSNGLSDRHGRDAAVACAASYRRAMRDFAAMDVLDVWYARMDDSDFLAMMPKDRKAVLSKRIAKAKSHSGSELVFPKLAEMDGQDPHIHDMPPTIFHPDAATAAGNLALIREALPKYRETLAEDLRVLFDRYHLVDAAVKVVGIGSVGTLCMILLMMSEAGHPLFLQVKEANARAQGFEWAQKIQAAADRERTTMLADADEQSTITRGEGEAEADKVVAEAYDRDPDFFKLYRMLQAYRQSLAQTSSTIVLSPGSEFLRLFEAGPNPSPAPWR